MATKQFQRVEIKDAAKGEVSAVFSTFNVLDHDGDVTEPGAFTDGADVVISAYGHTSWGGALPVGAGKIRTTAAEAIMDGQFFMDTKHGSDTFHTVKQLSARGLGEWSYGYDVLDSGQGEFDGKDARFLKALRVHEVSPVMQGAGIGTRTLAAKAGAPAAIQVPGDAPYSHAIKPHDSPTTAKAWRGLEVAAAIPDGDVNALRKLFAWVDPTGDPETKASYRMLHHHPESGEANVRACLIGIAILNGAPGKSVPGADRRAVWNHLAAHLEEADREPPELRASTSGPLKFTEEAVAVLAAMSALNDRASEVMAMRAVKGKGLAAGSADLLEWVYDELRGLKSMIDTPQEDAARELARFIRNMTQGA